MRVVRQALFMGGGTFLLTLTVRQLDEHIPEKSLQLLKYLEICSLWPPPPQCTCGLNKAVFPVFPLIKKSSLQRHFRCF